ncbi:hypothetical protein RR46_01689 [Papilio xuthus]|uniref:Uncharacterized protein n=1 Tax=Papilio xuthus TaxID=66420 RepID=A0A0N1I5Z9_PAPXU|nr:hypothetical protein RR46_01689 [Papilio xuthus]
MAAEHKNVNTVQTVKQWTIAFTQAEKYSCTPTRWSDQVQAILGLNITTALRQAEDRTAWRQLVDTAVEAYQDKHDLQ